MLDINWLAILVASLAVFVIGGPWYGPVFGAAWAKAQGVDPEEMRRKVPHPARVFAGAFVYGLVGSMVVAVLAGPGPDIIRGLVVGGGVGVAAAAAFGINYGFLNKPVSLVAIDGVYNIVLFTAMGAVIGVFG